MLLYLGFPIKLVQWVMMCVSMVTYSIVVNGEPLSPLRHKKGLGKVTYVSLLVCPFYGIFVKKVVFFIVYDRFFLSSQV